MMRSVVVSPAGMSSPAAIAVMPGGGFLVADQLGHAIHHVSPSGRSHPIRALVAPADVSPTPDGGFLVAEAGADRVSKVGRDGRVTVVADELRCPSGVEALPDGGFLVVELHGHRVLQFSPGGVATVIAGTGRPGALGDGRPSWHAELNHPAGIALLPDGDLLIADSGNNRIRRVGGDGSITSVAGCGTGGCGGDVGPARRALLSNPAAVAAAPDGGFLIADTGNGRVRRVSPGGTITTLVSGPDLPAPAALAVISGGGVLVGDRVTGALRLFDSWLSPAPGTSGTRSWRNTGKTEGRSGNHQAMVLMG